MRPLPDGALKSQDRKKGSGGPVSAPNTAHFEIASRTQTVGHLLYWNNEHRVQRENLVLEGSRPMVLRYRSGKAEPRPESHIRIRDLWLGSDSGTCSDRQNRMADLLVSQRWLLPCAHQSECPQSRKP